LRRNGVPVDDGDADRDDPTVGLPVTGSWADLREVVATTTPERRAVLELALDEYAALDVRPSAAGFAAWWRTLPPAERPGASTTTEDRTARQRRGLTVATFHAAKGREWRGVVVAGLDVAERSSARVVGAERDEEQRLCYVALSRATELLACTWAAERDRGDGPQARRRSPYLDAVVTTCRTLAASARPVPPPAGVRAAVPVRVPPPEHVSHRRAALLAWRDRRAVAADVAPAAVLSDAAVDALAADPPVGLEELARNPLIGPVRAARLGPSLLDALGGAAPAPGLSPVPPRP
jgi:hypothetical protein